MGKVKKAIILAAGLGTRMLPATKAIPKEMITVFGKPLIQHTVEEAIESGIQDIQIIVGPQHQEIIDHFHGEGRAKEHAVKTNNNQTITELKASELPANIEFTTQHEPLGTAHAVLQAKTFIGQDSFALLFPDDIILNPEGPNCTTQLTKAFTAHEANIIAVETVPPELIPFYGIVKLKENAELSETSSLFPVQDLIEKPTLESAPSSLGIVGRYVLKTEIFEAIENLKSSPNGELHITHALSLLSGTNREVCAYMYSGARYDTGRPTGHVLANFALAWEDPLAKQELSKYIKQLILKTD